MPGPSALPAVNDVLKLAQALREQYGMDHEGAVNYATKLLDQDHVYGQVPVSPVPTKPAALTPDHLEDANLSAWQQFSSMLEAQPNAMRPLASDPAQGQPTGQRKSRPNAR